MANEEATVVTEPKVHVARRGEAWKRQRAADRERADRWITAFIKHWNDQPLTIANPRPWKSGVPSLPVWKD